jgi:peptidoglycan/LPS O-acetylase OafA/YrhL
MNVNKLQNAISTETKNPHLEAFRGIMALLVVVSHVEVIKFYFGISQNYLQPFVCHLGRVAVTGFFVLSGYLITLSILKSLQTTTWKTSHFYIRRTLRILPLYYFMVCMALFVLPHVSALAFKIPHYVVDGRLHERTYWYYLLLLPQLTNIESLVIPFAEPTWSIGVEELFYLIAPLSIVVFKNKIEKALLIFVIGYVALKLMLLYVAHLSPYHYVYQLLCYHRFECIGMGCLLAAWQINKREWLHKIKAWHFYASIVLIAILLYKKDLYSYSYTWFALLFMILIAYLIEHAKKLRSPKWLVFIGKISFSLYLAHEIGIVALLNSGLIKPTSFFIYPIVIIIAILMGILLYYSIEKPFMQLAKRLTQKEVL